MKVLTVFILSASALAGQSSKTPVPVAQDALGGKSVPTVLTHSLGIPSKKTSAKAIRSTAPVLATYVPDPSAPPSVETPPLEWPQWAEQPSVPQPPDTPVTPEAPPAAEPNDLPAPPVVTTYLIAYKDHSISAALAYWVEDDTLHYVTPQNTHNQASLNLIDVERSYKLNADQSVPFSLPGK
jgi:hypothetical protein